MSNRERIDNLRAEADAKAREKARAPEPKAGGKAKAAGKAKSAGRVRFVWSVCGPSGKEEVQFPYAQEEAARAEAVRRTEETGKTHFVTRAEVPVD